MVEFGKGAEIAFQTIGKGVGRMGKPVLDSWLGKELRNFSVIPHSLEILRSTNGPFILASNHVAIPKSDLERTLSGLSPDTHILARLIKEQLKKGMHTIGLSDMGTSAELKDSKDTTKGFIVQNLHAGLLRGMGHYPFKDPKKDISSLRSLYSWIEENIIKRGDVLLIYPVGKWTEDFNPEEELLRGIGHIALRFGIPVIPAYIVGCDRWDVLSHTPVDVYFGNKIVADAKIKPQRNEISRIVEETRNRISSLRTQHIT